MCQTPRQCPVAPHPRTRGVRDPAPLQPARHTAMARAGATTTAARPTARGQLWLRLRPVPLPPGTTRARGGRRWPCRPRRWSCGQPASGTSDTAGVAAATDHYHHCNEGPARPSVPAAFHTCQNEQCRNAKGWLLGPCLWTPLLSPSLGGRRCGSALRGYSLWLHFVWWVPHPHHWTGGGSTSSLQRRELIARAARLKGGQCSRCEERGIGSH